MAVVLTYDQCEDTLRALESLHQASYAPLTVVLVDNGSSDGTADVVAERYPNVHVLRHDTNLGAATGRNTGIEFADTHRELRRPESQEQRRSTHCEAADVDRYRSSQRVAR